LPCGPVGGLCCFSVGSGGRHPETRVQGSGFRVQAAIGCGFRVLNPDH
jgi:hypothetical protein